MNDAKHTPGPWACEFWHEDMNCEIRGPAPAGSHNRASVASVILEADARLICLAVNAHADLLAFVQELQIEYAAFMANDSEIYPERLIYHASGAGMVIAKATGCPAEPKIESEADKAYAVYIKARGELCDAVFTAAEPRNDSRLLLQRAADAREVFMLAVLRERDDVK